MKLIPGGMYSGTWLRPKQVISRVWFWGLIWLCFPWWCPPGERPLDGRWPSMNLCMRYWASSRCQRWFPCILVVEIHLHPIGQGSISTLLWTNPQKETHRIVAITKYTRKITPCFSSISKTTKSDSKMSNSHRIMLLFLTQRHFQLVFWSWIIIQAYNCIQQSVLFHAVT